MALILLIGYLIASLLSVFTVHLTIFLIIRLIQGLAGGCNRHSQSFYWR